MDGPVSRVAGARRCCCHSCRRYNEPVIIVEADGSVKGRSSKGRFCARAEALLQVLHALEQALEGGSRSWVGSDRIRERTLLQLQLLQQAAIEQAAQVT